MPLQFVSGDPLLTQCQTLAIGHNSVGRTEVEMFATSARRQFPTAYANYERRCKQGKFSGGDFYLWGQSTPQILFLIVRDSGVGATRLRYIQQSLLTLARDYKMHGIQSLALAPLGQKHERDEITLLLKRWFNDHPLTLVVYTAYQAGVHAEKI